MTQRGDWKDAVEAYLTSAAANGASPQTLKLRRWQLRWLARELTDVHPWSVTVEQLERLLAHEPWAKNTRRSRVSAVRSFYRWAWRAGHMPSDLSLLLPSVKVEMGLPRPCPEPELAIGLARADQRVRLMILLGAYAGLRAGEIARVHSDDLSLDDRLLVHGKGGKDRVVPLIKEEAVDRVRAARGWVFPGRFGAGMTSGHVTKLVSATLPGGWTCHTLRHRLGTRVYEETGDLAVVQEILGHASPETTRIYTRVPQARMVAALRLAG